MSVKTINYNMYSPRLATISCLRLATILHKLKVVDRVSFYDVGWADVYRKVRGFDIEAIKRNNGVVMAKEAYEQEST